MRATTIKLEGELLAKLERVKPRSMSISAYVRSLIETDVRRHALAAAAREYQAFLASTKSEAESLDEWLAADLVSPPRESAP